MSIVAKKRRKGGYGIDAIVYVRLPDETFVEPSKRW